ncbi:MAG: hypothetical protein IIB42_09500, partial [Candidatus Marinimicrobia bacterium]|nr:hypothetical protein [Candidatus Neomarinimicrobiota bacterium]
GVKFVAGVDEAVRVPHAGPVVAAAVILPPDLTGAEPWLQFLDDSKKLSQVRRERAADAVHQHALAVGVGIVSPADTPTSISAPARKESMVRSSWYSAWCSRSPG